MSTPTQPPLDQQPPDDNSKHEPSEGPGSGRPPVVSLLTTVWLTLLGSGLLIYESYNGLDRPYLIAAALCAMGLAPGSAVDYFRTIGKK